MDFGRVITAMVTPFDEDLNVNYQVMAKLSNYLISNGSDSLLVSGTTGESPTLDMSEKIKLFETVLDSVKGKSAVIAGTGSYSTKDSILLSKEAEKVGVNGLLLVVPYYNKPPQYALYEHFKSIASSVNIPVILYNVPGRTVRNLEPETVTELSKIDNIVGIKEASGNMDQVSAIKQGVPEDFKIYSGDDSMTLPMLSLGSYGVISVASHLVGKEIKEMIKLFINGNTNEASKKHLEIFKLFRAMFINSNPIPLKYAMKIKGWDIGEFRPPLYDLKDGEKEYINKILNEYNLL